MILILLSIVIQDPLISKTFKDSLNEFIIPKFIQNEIELFQIHPDHLKYLGPCREDSVIERERPSLQSYRKRANGVDTVRIAVIRVEFLEDTTSVTTGNGRFNLEGIGNVCDTILDTTGTGNSLTVDTSFQRNLYYDPPHDFVYFNRLMEFLHNYYWKVSYNSLWLEWKVLPESTDSGYVLPHKLTYYGDPENYVLGLCKLLRDAIEVADYEENFNGIDEIIVFHAGSMYQTDNLGDSYYDLPACSIHRLHEIFGSYLIADGDTFDSGIIYPETGFQDGYAAYLQGGLCHEFGHSETLGLLDLYDVSGNRIGMGGWALMGTGNWNIAGLVPPRLCAYNRLKTGFDKATLIDEDTTSLPLKWTGSMDKGVPRIYKIPINKDEYFLIENRFTYTNPDTFHSVNPCTTRVDSNGYRVWKDDVLVNIDDYESSLPPDHNSGGLAIWHIDEEKISETENQNMINVGWPLGVDLEEADGIQDFEKGVYKVQNSTAAFTGSQLDVFSKEGFNHEFSTKTEPNTQDNFGNWTGIRISNISPPDTIMYFDVSFDKVLTGFPKKFGEKMDVISPQNVANSIYVGDMFGGVYRVNSDDTLFRMAQLQDSAYSDSTYTSPLIADLTGDGDLELFDMTIHGKIFLYDISSDSLLDSLSVSGNIYGNASVSDLLPGGGKEVLFGTSSSELHMFRWDNNELVEADGFPLYVGDWLVSTPLVIGKAIYVFPGDGTLLKVSTAGDIKWRSGEENPSYSLSSPVAGDIDRDGIKEIICSAGSKTIYAVDTTGTIEWEKNLPAKTYFSTPALGDINEDGYLDVVLADSANIFALNRNGVLLDNFPIKIHLSRQTQSSIILSDVNGDSLPEIIFGSPDGGVLAYNGEGEKVMNFPFATGKRAYSTPLICDINSDGFSELFIGSDDGWLYGWETEGFYRDNSWNRIYFNNDHQSVFPDSCLPERMDTAGKLTIEEFYVYPSPVRGGKEAFIRFRLGAPADRVVIRVYSLSGRLITEKMVAGHFGPNDIRIDRELSGEANGVYFATIEVAGKASRKLKFGVLNKF